MKRILGLSGLMLTLCLNSMPVHSADAPAMDPDLRGKAQRATDAGLHFLRQTQAADGSWSNSVGVTAIALRAFVESYRTYDEGDGPFITRPVKFLLDHVNEDGSISETNQNRNYNTAVAINALAALKNPKYDTVIKNALNYLKKDQIDEGEGYEKDHKYYGGIGYGGDERPDLSNQYFAVEALKAADVAKDDPVWQKAVTFINRCQNRSESNDQSWASNDGGFTYMPGSSPHAKTASYGGMTHAGLLSLLYAGTDRNDPRIKAAYDWVRAHYSVDENPGAKDNQGLFYYYNVFAKSMYAYGDAVIKDSKGVDHNWRNDLSKKLLSMQGSDGSWVNPYSNRWWEGDKNLATAWSAVALNLVVR